MCGLRHRHPHRSTGTSRARPARPDERVGDDERSATLERLAEHFAAGRLTETELDERSTLASEARTRRDLAALEADLPRPPGRRPSPRRRVEAAAACHAWWVVPVGLVIVL